LGEKKSKMAQLSPEAVPSLPSFVGRVGTAHMVNVADKPGL